MTLTLHLTPEIESRLVELANLAGKRPEAVALEVIEDTLAERNGPLPQASSLVEFQTWFAAHPMSNTPSLDDSREAIYAGRGE